MGRPLTGDRTAEPTLLTARIFAMTFGNTARRQDSDEFRDASRINRPRSQGRGSARPRVGTGNGYGHQGTGGFHEVVAVRDRRQ